MKFYMHAGSFNHGCEAIVRSTASMICEKIELFSEYPEEDIKVNLNDICKVIHQGHARNKKDIRYVLCKLMEILFHSNVKYRYLYKNILCNVKKADVCVSIGGDNYCYGNNPNLIYLNQVLNKKGCKTVLWGCSIEPQSLLEPSLIADMSRYTLITARESITYEALIKAGINKHTYLFPDPAFSLETEEFDMGEIFIGNGLVGINISPLIVNKETKEGIILKNYEVLIDYILQNTKLNILLIPHVCKSKNDDNVLVDFLYDEFINSRRIFRINESGKMNCKQLKYAISKCRYIVAARTHVSIAAYSLEIPTLVVGYSVKARGIAKDIFGDIDKFVMDICSINKEDDIKDKFVWIIQNEDNIKQHLSLVMPEYISRSRKAGNLLNRIIRGEEFSYDMGNYY